MNFHIKAPLSGVWISPPINLRNGQTLWLSSEHPLSDSWNFPCPTTTYYFQYLQSNLQKAMRRGLHDVCIATSYQMMQQDFPKFLRRLSIILLEDVWPHPRLDYVVWLMVAVAKGWKISKMNVDQLLQIIWEASHQPRPPQYNKKNEFPTIEEDTPNLIRAMIVRQNYGGMRGDLQMLASLVDIWTIKMGQGYNLEADWPDVGTFTLVTFREDHRLPEAIDFHNSNIVTVLSFRLKIDPILVRKDLWDNRSSINARSLNWARQSLSLPKQVVDELSMDIWSTHHSKKTSNMPSDTPSDTPSVLEFLDPL